MDLFSQLSSQRNTTLTSTWFYWASKTTQQFVELKSLVMKMPTFPLVVKPVLSPLGNTEDDGKEIFFFLLLTLNFPSLSPYLLCSFFLSSCPFGSERSWTENEGKRRKIRHRWQWIVWRLLVKRIIVNFMHYVSSKDCELWKKKILRENMPSTLCALGLPVKLSSLCLVPVVVFYACDCEIHIYEMSRQQCLG